MGRVDPAEAGRERDIIEDASATSPQAPNKRMPRGDGREDQKRGIPAGRRKRKRQTPRAMSVSSRHVQRTHKGRTSTHQGRRKPRPSFSFLPEHIDFVCVEMAEFRGVDRNALIAACLHRFPDYPPGRQNEQDRREWWATRLGATFPHDRYGNVTDDCKWRDRIAELRDAWRRELRDSVPLANRRQRLLELERLYNLALKDKVVRIFAVKQVIDGHVRYEHKVVTQPDVAEARRCLETIRAEMGDDHTQEEPTRKLAAGVIELPNPIPFDVHVGPDAKPDDDEEPPAVDGDDE